jgi:Xaa-Pro aminopeptidase
MQVKLQKRISKLRERISAQKLQALLITESNNISYLTGERNLSHDWHDAALVLTHKTCLLMISPLRKQKTENLPKTLTIKKSNDFFSEIESLCKKQKILTLGIEQDNLRLTEFKKLKKVLAPITLKSTKQLVEKQRMIKDEQEIENIKKACRITVSVFKKIKKALTPGRTEKEIAWEIEKLLKEEGSEGIPQGFSPIAAFGNNSAIPHHQPTDRKLRNRDIVLLDFGCTYQDYASDFTRVVFIGKATKLQTRVFKLITKAQKRAFAAFAETSDPKKIDKTARDFITKAGYGKFFIHNTGHSLGLSIHEIPAISQEEKTLIQPGMIFTVEPGVYLPKRFGIRHEDTILVTPDGAEILTKE